MTQYDPADYPLLRTPNQLDDTRTPFVPPPTIPRLALTRIQAHHAILDGAWWPRSWDAAAEFPGLIQALTIHFGPIRALLANREAWDSRIRRFPYDRRDVEMCWFSSLDATTVAATTHRGDQFDLLVVPPETTAEIAACAMTAAADQADLRRASQILNRSALVVWDRQTKEY